MKSAQFEISPVFFSFPFLFSSMIVLSCLFIATWRLHAVVVVCVLFKNRGICPFTPLWKIKKKDGGWNRTTVLPIQPAIHHLETMKPPDVFIWPVINTPSASTYHWWIIIYPLGLTVYRNVAESRVPSSNSITNYKNRKINKDPLSLSLCVNIYLYFQLFWACLNIFLIKRKKKIGY